MKWVPVSRQWIWQGGNIEGVITSLIRYEGVGDTPAHGNILNEQTIQVP